MDVSTAVPQLGKLDPVDPRLMWKNEAHDFTPWLLANGELLAEALGIDLELEASEHPVGGGVQPALRPVAVAAVTTALPQ